MDNATHLGLDVHKDTIAVAVLRQATSNLTNARSRTHARLCGP